MCACPEAAAVAVAEAAGVVVSVAVVVAVAVPEAAAVLAVAVVSASSVEHRNPKQLWLKLFAIESRQKPGIAAYARLRKGTASSSACVQPARTSTGPRPPGSLLHQEELAGGGLGGRETLHGAPQGEALKF